MAKIVIQKKIKAFNKVINVDGDKSLSIRSLLIGSQSYGICKIRNLPKSEDILSTIEGLKKLGIKIYFKKKICFLYGNGLNGFNYKKKYYYKCWKFWYVCKTVTWFTYQITI